MREGVQKNRNQTEKERKKRERSRGGECGEESRERERERKTNVYKREVDWTQNITGHCPIDCILGSSPQAYIPM